MRRGLGLLPPLLAAALVSVCCSCAATPAPAAQAPAAPSRWQPEIDAFLADDLAHAAPPGCVVFVGSSSIRLWDSLAEDMAPVPALNRGFGGSQLHDAIHHADELVLRHDPALVVVFSGSNDLAGQEAKQPEEVQRLFRQLVTRLRTDDAERTIVFIAITPTLARDANRPAVAEANRRIRLDCESDPYLEFVDPSVDLLDADGLPDPQWFQDDRLHLNDRGYQVWTRHLRPVVHRLHARETARLTCPPKTGPPRMLEPGPQGGRSHVLHGSGAPVRARGHRAGDHLQPGDGTTPSGGSSRHRLRRGDGRVRRGFWPGTHHRTRR